MEIVKIVSVDIKDATNFNADLKKAVDAALAEDVNPRWELHGAPFVTTMNNQVHVMLKRMP